MTTADASAELRWLDLDRAVRRRVARAVRKGRRIEDPRDAALAVGYAEASTGSRAAAVCAPSTSCSACWLIVTWTWPVTSLLYPALGFGFLRPRTPALRRRLTAAREANAELAAEWEPYSGSRTATRAFLAVPQHASPARRGRVRCAQASLGGRREHDLRAGGDAPETASRAEARSGRIGATEDPDRAGGARVARRPRGRGGPHTARIAARSPGADTRSSSTSGCSPRPATRACRLNDHSERGRASARRPSPDAWARRPARASEGHT